MAPRNGPNAVRRTAAVSRDFQAAFEHHQAGNLDQAEALYRKALRKAPDHVDALHLLGGIAHERGRAEDAVQLISRAVALSPNLVAAHLNLGAALQGLNRLHEAAASFRTAISLQRDYAYAYCNLSTVLNLQGACASALENADRALELMPGLLDAVLNRAAALRSLRRFAEAEAAYRSAHALQPNRAEILSDLAQTLTDLQKLDEAIACHRQAVELAAESATVHYLHALTLLHIGELEAAEASCRRALSFDPNFARGWSGLGQVLRARGRFDEAESSFRRALELDPQVSHAYAGLALLGQQPDDEVQLQRLGDLIEGPDQQPLTRISAGFALGMLLDNADRYDQAFPCFAAANARYRELLAGSGELFDAASLRQRVDGLIEACTPDRYSAIAEEGNPSEVPVFIVGMPRSGTSLVEQIFATHSQVSGAGELKNISDIADAVQAHGQDRPMEELDPHLARRLAGDYVAQLLERGGGAARVTDKMPDNIFHLGLIAVLFPRARVILVRRDLRDTCLSCYFRWFDETVPWAYDLAECGLRGLEIERLAEHWRWALPLRMLTIDYENLVADFEGESRRLIEFLGLDWEPGCLEFYKTDRPVLSASAWQVRQPLYTRSVGRWRRYEQHLGPLLEVLEKGGITPMPGLPAVGHRWASDAKQRARRAGGITRTVNAGFSHHGAGRLERAEELYRKALQKDPDHPEALHLLGVVAYQRGEPETAIALIERALPELQDLPEAHLNLGNALREAGRRTEAVESYRRAIALTPDYGMAYSNLARALNDQGLFEAALESSRRALALIPEFLGAHVNRATALLGLERFAEAEPVLRGALTLDPDLAEAHNDLGNALHQQGRLDEAIDSYGRALALRPDFAAAHTNLGTAQRAQNRFDDAIASYRRALAAAPNNASTHYNLGNAFFAHGQIDSALESYRQALALNPDLTEAHSNLGQALQVQYRLDEAVAAYRRALSIAPSNALFHYNLGSALQGQRRLDDAVASYRQAIDLDPDLVSAHYSLGLALYSQGKLQEAIAPFRRVEVLAPGNADALAAWLHVRKYSGDWAQYRESETKTREAVGLSPALTSAFIFLTLSSTPGEQFDCARQVAAKVSVPETARLPRRQPQPGGRIHIGYLSADFRPHPVAVLIPELIERHDRRRFEVSGYSLGPENGSAVRARLARAFDRFVDIDSMPHREAAERIHADAVDILIDLNGYTRDGRPVIPAYRPAPIQVNYLGFPGTMGADFIDYIIVDRFLVPMDQQRFYTERLVHLPNCYQPNDTTREIARPGRSRAECGLSEGGFVFCCFNGSYKITPAIFEIWMDLLEAMPGSVLWLAESNALAKDNLRREAAGRGVAPERLVFAPRVPMAEYLAYLRLADLFLDTLPYNAGATANDALWAGLPVLTCAGKTYAGRMAGALLKAVGLTELITTSLEEYAALALRLAQKPEMLAQLRARLAQNRATHPLFDTECFTRNLEAAYGRMWETWNAGQAPAAFSVSPSFNSSLGQPSRDI